MIRHIEIVSSADGRLSSMSAQSRQMIRGVLAKHFPSVGITLVSSLADLEALVAKQPDLVFLGMKSIPSQTRLGEDVWLSDYLDDQGIAYTGSGASAHELESNKPLAKRAVLSAGFGSARYHVADQTEILSADGLKLDYPLFIKPSDRGGGAGVDSLSVANSFDEVTAKVRNILDSFGSNSLIEEYLPGREFSVAILRQELSEELLVMPIEIVAEPDENGLRMLSNQAKTDNKEQVLAVEPGEERDELTTLAINVFKTLGGRDYGRIDIRMDGAGTPKFLEANLIPSLIEGYGSFPKACLLNQNLAYETIILRIVSLALSRGAAASGVPV